jgi:hypothetical protein
MPGTFSGRLAGAAMLDGNTAMLDGNTYEESEADGAQSQCAWWAGAYRSPLSPRWPPS